MEFFGTLVYKNKYSIITVLGFANHLCQHCALFSNIKLTYCIEEQTRGSWVRGHSPKSKNIWLLGEGKLVLLCVGRELLDDFWGQVTQPAVGDPQFVFSPAPEWENVQTLHCSVVFTVRCVCRKLQWDRSVMLLFSYCARQTSFLKICFYMTELWSKIQYVFAMCCVIANRLCFL